MTNAKRKQDMTPAESAEAEQDETLEEGLEDTFPASDPPSATIPPKSDEDDDEDNK